MPLIVTNENTKWSLRKKIFAVVCAIIIFILVVISTKAIYDEATKLDNLNEMAQKTQDMVDILDAIDRNLTRDLNHFENTSYDDLVTTVGY